MFSRIFCGRCARFGNGQLEDGHMRLEDSPVIQLDTCNMGKDVVIVKNGRRICGSGAALANAPILQNKAYFEAKVQSGGVWGIGLATSKCSLDNAPLGQNAESWVLRDDGTLWHNNKQYDSAKGSPLQEGDVIGVSYDHTEQRFYLNGRPMNIAFSGIKGTVFPVLYVDDGAILDVFFSQFINQPPSGYEEIMLEKSLL